MKEADKVPPSPSQDMLEPEAVVKAQEESAATSVKPEEQKDPPLERSAPSPRAANSLRPQSASNMGQLALAAITAIALIFLLRKMRK